VLVSTDNPRDLLKGAIDKRACYFKVEVQVWKEKIVD